jgi:hypothetical protein
VTLAKFYESLHGTTGLGQLVQHLHIDIDEYDAKPFHQENKNILAGIRDLVPNLRSLRCTRAPTFGSIFLDQIRAFGELEEAELSTGLSKYIDLLKMHKLKAVHLILLGGDSNVENSTEIASNVRQLSLEKLYVYTRTPPEASPLLIRFLQSIKAKDVTLQIRKV